MDYLATYPDRIFEYHVINMIVNIEDESSYNVLPKACSCAANWFIFVHGPAKVHKPMNHFPLHMMYNTIKNFISSTSKAETGII